MNDPVTTCIRTAERQHGVISRVQARAAGLSDDALERLVKKRRWIRRCRGSYALWTPTEGRARWLQVLMAVCLWLGETAAVSHRAGAVVLDLDGLDSAPPEFTSTTWRRSDDEGIVLHRTTSVPPMTMVGPLPVTSAARTIADLAGVVDPATPALAYASAIRRRLTSRDLIRAELGPRTAGRRALLALLDADAGAATDSALEVLVERVLVGAGLDRPVRQHVVLDAWGRFVARVDLAYPRHRVAVEADSVRFHASAGAVIRDRRRQNELIGQGWTVYRVTWEDATRHPRRVARDVRTLLARADR